MATKLRIVHKINHNFKFSNQIDPAIADLYTGKGEWFGRESYIIERREKVTWFGAEEWVRAGTDHWYKRDSFGTFEEAKEALKYYDGTVEQFTVVWESP